MEDVIIRAEGLGKKYLIGHETEREWHPTLRDTIVETGRSVMARGRRMLRGAAVPGDTIEDFWALKDVSFEVRRGEVLGIIGRNGAGKSTLLKVLSRITEPTEGRVTIDGRVASLLEVGTGFHPELTGRENVYLNGAILGMTRTEIRRKFDEIVAFAEVERFLDTPVKRYSSGMYVRLAFAVAAHLEPDILVVDEVLAVGDAEFQRKCLYKMSEVAGVGRTVLFVSHNLTSIRQLCTRGLLFAGGKIVAAGSANHAADRYLNGIFVGTRGEIKETETGYVRFSLVDSIGSELAAVTSEQEVYVDLELHVAPGTQVHAGFTILDQQDVAIVLCASEYGGVLEIGPGRHRFAVKLPNQLLRPGFYRIEGAVWNDREVFYQNENLIRFQTMPARIGEMLGRGSSALFCWRDRWTEVPRTDALKTASKVG
jgi:lipopolysaccharide transport system ATP-binding protein